jgi:hypothetical protein
MDAPSTLDLMTTREIIEYLGRKRFMSLAIAGIPPTNSSKDIKVISYVTGRKNVECVQQDLNEKIEKFKVDNPDKPDWLPNE